MMAGEKLLAYSAYQNQLCIMLLCTYIPIYISRQNFDLELLYSVTKK